MIYYTTARTVAHSRPHSERRERQAVAKGLQSAAPDRQARTMLGKRQDIRADSELDPTWAEFSVQRETKGGAIELAHSEHLPREDDGVVDAANRKLRIHGARSLLVLPNI